MRLVVAVAIDGEIARQETGGNDRTDVGIAVGLDRGAPHGIDVAQQPFELALECRPTRERLVFNTRRHHHQRSVQTHDAVDAAILIVAIQIAAGRRRRKRNLHRAEGGCGERDAGARYGDNDGRIECVAQAEQNRIAVLTNNRRPGYGQQAGVAEPEHESSSTVDLRNITFQGRQAYRDGLRQGPRCPRQQAASAGHRRHHGAGTYTQKISSFNFH